MDPVRQPTFHNLDVGLTNHSGIYESQSIHTSKIIEIRSKIIEISMRPGLMLHAGKSSSIGYSWL